MKNEKQQECWELTFSEYANKNGLKLPSDMDESTCEWFDSLRDDGRNPDGSGESYSGRNQ